MSVKKINNNGSRVVKTKKKPLCRADKIRIVVIVILAVILALMLAFVIGYKSWVKAPALTPKPEVSMPGQTVTDPGTVDEQPGNEVEQPVSDRKDNFFTFLVVGRDTGGGGNTDTIMLGAYDIANQKLNVMSIPRDTMVNVPWDIKRINGVYGMNGGKEKGIAALYTEVSQLVGFVPDYSIVVEWKAVGELVDAIGGVDFNVPYYMDYDDSTQNLHIHFNKGMQHLNGKDAMNLLRWRQNSKFNEDGSYTLYNTVGDTGRIKIQQDFLKEVLKQCLQIKNVTRINELAKVFTDNVQTDLTIGNLVWFAEQAIFGGLTMENVSFMSMPGNYEGYAWSPTYQNNQSYVFPDPEALLAAINEGFNPYREDRTMEQLDIMSKNSDGSLSSSTGVVEDKVAAKPPVKKPKPTPKPEPSEEPTEEPGSTSDMPGWLGGNEDEGSEPTQQPGQEPTQQPTQQPEPTPEPSATPRPSATPAPTPTPKPSATPAPTPTPTPEPTPAPTPTDDLSNMPAWLRP